MTKIHTHDDGEDRRRQMCRCSICTKVAQCTPGHDFFCETEGGPLICEPCFMKRHFKPGTPVVLDFKYPHS